jgi:DUF4097 and DUF4098 domain-containing protein YvlB
MKIITKSLIIIFCIGLVMTIVSVYNGLSYSAINEFLNDDDTFSERIYYQEGSVIHTIVLDIIDRSVFVAQGTDEFVTFNYYSQEDDTWTVTEVNGVLTIKQTKSRNILGWINYKVYTKTLKNMYITLPINRDMNLDLSNHVGDISIYNNDNYFEYIKVDQSTGNFGLRDVNVNELDLSLGTGNMLLKNVIVDGDTTISNHTGQIKFEGGNYQLMNVDNDTGTIVLTDLVAKELDLKTSTGNVSTNNITVQNTMKATSQTGKVIINNTSSSGFNLSTKTGDVIFATSSGNQLKFDLSTSTGKITINNVTQGSPYSTQTGTILLKIRVSTGNIRITTQ